MSFPPEHPDLDTPAPGGEAAAAATPTPAPLTPGEGATADSMIGDSGAAAFAARVAALAAAASAKAGPVAATMPLATTTAENAVAEPPRPDAGQPPAVATATASGYSDPNAWPPPGDPVVAASSLPRPGDPVVAAPLLSRPGDPVVAASSLSRPDDPVSVTSSPSGARDPVVAGSFVSDARDRAVAELTSPAGVANGEFAPAIVSPGPPAPADAAPWRESQAADDLPAPALASEARAAEASHALAEASDALAGASDALAGASDALSFAAPDIDAEAPSSVVPALVDDQELAPPRPMTRRERFRSWRFAPVVEVLATVALALALAESVQAAVVKPFVIPSQSMEPTLLPGQRVLVDRLAYDFGGTPQRGDIVVFHPPSSLSCKANVPLTEPCPVSVSTHASDYFVKRVIGLPGDRLAIKDGHPVINGTELTHEPYIMSCAGSSSCNMPHSIVIPRGEYYMLGDNRGDSDDSRYWGPVPLSWIICQVFATYWPLDRIGIF